MNGKIAGTICERQLAPSISGTCIQAALLMMLTVGVSLDVLSVCNQQAIAADPASATTAINPSLVPDAEPLDLKALQPGNTPADLVTASSISPTHLTIPSLWWLQEQTADKDPYGGKLLENWLAYPNGSSNHPGRVDLVVNRQFWSLLDYLDRYAFIHAFGKAARDYGYNIRVFDGQATFLGASTCDFSAVNIDALQTGLRFGRNTSSDRSSAVAFPPALTDTIPCSIQLDSTGKSGLRGRSNQLLPGAGSSKALDTAQP